MWKLSRGETQRGKGDGKKGRRHGSKEQERTQDTVNLLGNGLLYLKHLLTK